MGKIGNYNMEVEEELSDQLNKLGFESLQDALSAGYIVTEHVIRGIPTPVLWKIPTPINLEEEQKAYEEAHEAWLKEKEEVLSILHSLKFDIEFTKLEQTITDEYHAMIDKVINFIERGEK